MLFAFPPPRLYRKLEQPPYPPPTVFLPWHMAQLLLHNYHILHEGCVHEVFNWAEILALVVLSCAVGPNCDPEQIFRVTLVRPGLSEVSAHFLLPHPLDIDPARELIIVHYAMLHLTDTLHRP